MKGSTENSTSQLSSLIYRNNFEVHEYVPIQDGHLFHLPSSMISQDLRCRQPLSLKVCSFYCFLNKVKSQYFGFASLTVKHTPFTETLAPFLRPEINSDEDL